MKTEPDQTPATQDRPVIIPAQVKAQSQAQTEARAEAQTETQPAQAQNQPAQTQPAQTKTQPAQTETQPAQTETQPTPAPTRARPARVQVVPAQVGPARRPASVGGRPAAGEALPSVDALPGVDSLSGRHLLLVSGRSVEAEGPGLNALAVHLESVAGKVSILPSGSVIGDLIGRRVIGRPDLVVAILPGRGASLAAVRVAERLGTPLLALVNSDEPGSWGEATTLRRATRVAVTNTGLRRRVAAAGVAPDRVELWRALLPSAMASFDQIAGRTLVRSAAGAGR